MSTTIRSLLESPEYTVDVYLVDFNKVADIRVLDNACVACVPSPKFNRDTVSQEVLVELSKFVGNVPQKEHSFDLGDLHSTATATSADCMRLVHHVNLLRTHRIHFNHLEFFSYLTLSYCGLTYYVYQFKALSHFVSQLASRAKCITDRDDKSRAFAEHALQQTIDLLRIENLLEIVDYEVEAKVFHLDPMQSRMFNLKVRFKLHSRGDTVDEMVFALPESLLENFSAVKNLNQRMATNIGLLDVAFPESLSVIGEENNLRQNTLEQALQISLKSKM